MDYVRDGYDLLAAQCREHVPAASVPDEVTFCDAHYRGDAPRPVPWRAALDEIFSDALAARPLLGVATAGWVVQGARDGVGFEYDGESGARNRRFRLTAHLECGPDALLSTLLEPELIGKLDPTTLCLRTLAVLEDGRDAGAALCHTVAKTGFPFRHRDFVDVTAWKRLPDGTVLQAARSCPTAAASLAPTAVRGVVEEWAYVLAPAAAGGTDLTLVSQTDLAGYMPTAVTNRRAAVSSQHSAQSRLPPHTLTRLLAAQDGWPRAGGLRSGAREGDDSSRAIKRKKTGLWRYLCAVVR